MKYLHFFFLLFFSQICLCQNLSFVENVLRHPGFEMQHYSVYYSDSLKNPVLIKYISHSYQIKGSQKRTNYFRPFRNRSVSTAKSSDFYRSGYDRGHLAPAADFKMSKIGMVQSFSYLNISPQVPAFNRGIWKKLEIYCRAKTLANDSLLILTGPVFSCQNPVIGKNSVSVPESFFKIIYINRKRVQSFLIPNEFSEKNIFNYLVSIDNIETVTGIDFFTNFSKEIQENFENKTFKKF